MSKKVLYLHIGHHKTGSSYLQTVFARNIKPLLENGIDYTHDPSNPQAAAGKITSGNGVCLEHLLWQYRAGNKEEATLARQAPAVLLSSEFLYFFLSATSLQAVVKSSTLTAPWMIKWAEVGMEERLDLLTEWAKDQGFEKIKILLLIRNPIEHCESWYQQLVKRSGEVASVDEYANIYDTPVVVRDLLFAARKHTMMEMTVLNYSVVRKNLFQVTADWLGVQPSCLDAEVPGGTVNRSLNRSELVLQRYVNEKIEASGALLADLFGNELPHIRSEKIMPSASTQRTMWNRLKPTIDEVNAILDSSQHYVFDQVEPASVLDQYFFSEAQLALIAQGLGGEIQRLSSEKSAFTQHIAHLQAELDQTEQRYNATSLAMAEEQKQLIQQRDKLKISQTTLKSKLEATAGELKKTKQELKATKSRKVPWYEKVFSKERWIKRLKRFAA